jgi:dienelactone hydrolase
MNVALIDLPYHLSRCRSGHGSGEGFFSSDLADMQATFRQGAADCIALVRYLQQRFGRPVGVWGTSLGGNMAAHVASHVDDLSAVVLMEPLDNPGHSIQLLRSSREIRDVLARHEVSAELVPAQLSAVAPSTHRPKVDPERILFVSGRWDRIIPFDLQDALWQAWGRPDRIVLDAGHLTLPGDQAMKARVLDFLARNLVSP